MSVNTGIKKYTELIEVYTDTLEPTGLIKPNEVGDPDYIEPVTDLVSCPLSSTVPIITCVAPLLQDIILVSGSTYELVFKTKGVNLTAITIQYSLDLVNWTNSTGGFISPRTITFPSIGLWYVRMVSICGSNLSVVSNTLSVYVNTSVDSFSPNTHMTSITAIDEFKYKFRFSLSSTLVAADIIQIQLGSLCSSGSTLTIDGSDYTLAGFGYLNIDSSLIPLDISNGYKEFTLSIPPGPPAYSYVQAILAKINNIPTIFGAPSTAYLSSDSVGAVTAGSN